MSTKNEKHFLYERVKCMPVCLVPRFIYECIESTQRRFLLWFLRVFFPSFVFVASPKISSLLFLANVCFNFRWEYCRNVAADDRFQSELAIAGECMPLDERSLIEPDRLCAWVSRVQYRFHVQCAVIECTKSSNWAQHLREKHFSKDTRVHINHKLRVSKWINRSLISNKKLQTRKKYK